MLTKRTLGNSLLLMVIFLFSFSLYAQPTIVQDSILLDVIRRDSLQQSGKHSIYVIEFISPIQCASCKEFRKTSFPRYRSIADSLGITVHFVCVLKVERKRDIDLYAKELWEFDEILHDKGGAIADLYEFPFGVGILFCNRKGNIMGYDNSGTHYLHYDKLFKKAVGKIKSVK